MKSFSSVSPEFLVQSNGNVYLNCNVQVQVVDEGTDLERTEFTYDTVLVTSVDRGSLISAAMQAKYTKDQEIAILNSHLLGTKPEAWDEYQLYREACKTYVDANLI